MDILITPPRKGQGFKFEDSIQFKDTNHQICMDLVNVSTLVSFIIPSTFLIANGPHKQTFVMILIKISAGASTVGLFVARAIHAFADIKGKLTTKKIFKAIL